jgi:hypothetical protein
LRPHWGHFAFLSSLIIGHRPALLAKKQTHTTGTPRKL